jgi:ribonuclease T2
VRLPISLALSVLLALAGGGARGAPFDYYVLALSWSPSWCALAGDARGAPQCAEGAGLGFTLHGLWPQYEEGWPEYCEARGPDPTRADAAAMSDVMGSAGLARHQWVKHGRCSGLDAGEYFAASRAAFEAVALPAPEEGAVRSTPAALRAKIRALNPDVPAEGLVVTCRAGLAAEVRLCLDRDLAPRACAPDVLVRSCAPERRVVLPAPR